MGNVLPATEDRIATSFNDAERKRFQGLLRLAAESPYVGERENALAAARRMAERHGMTVEEAAGMERPRAAQRRPDGSWRRTWFADDDAAEVGRFMHFNGYVINAAKSRRYVARQLKRPGKAKRYRAARKASSRKQQAKRLEQDRERERLKFRAYGAVHRAVKSGRLIRPDRCPRCGRGGNVQAHHNDYSKPLDVKWLCPTCHRVTHTR